MIARSQRFFVLTLLFALAGWLLWQWPQSPLRAVWGALLPAVLFLGLMVVEFVMMHTMNRTDDAPRSHLAEVVVAWWAEVRAAVWVFCWAQPFRSQAHPDRLSAPPTGRRGVVLVHGFMCNRAVWLAWFEPLRQAGHAYEAVNLEPIIGSIDDYAGTIEAAVQRVTAATGRAPVVVCHSMGGLAVRAWLRSHAADDRVHRVLTLGTPHGGTWAGRFSHAVNGRQMRLGGEWVTALQHAEPAGRAGLFVCWYSNCDNIVFPAGTAALAGAQNRLVRGVGHVQMALHAGVMRECLEEIGRD